MALKFGRPPAEANGMEVWGGPIAQWRLGVPPDTAHMDGAVSLTSARVLTIADRCWCCRSKVRGVVGVLVEMSAGRRFIPFTDIAPTLASAADPRMLAARGIGPLRHRDSPGIPGGYISNGCWECDALTRRPPPPPHALHTAQPRPDPHR